MSDANTIALFRERQRVLAMEREAFGKHPLVAEIKETLGDPHPFAAEGEACDGGYVVLFSITLWEYCAVNGIPCVRSLWPYNETPEERVMHGPFLIPHDGHEQAVVLLRDFVNKLVEIRKSPAPRTWL